MNKMHKCFRVSWIGNIVLIFKKYWIVSVQNNWAIYRKLKILDKFICSLIFKKNNIQKLMLYQFLVS